MYTTEHYKIFLNSIIIIIIITINNFTVQTE